MFLAQGRRVLRPLALGNVTGHKIALSIPGNASPGEVFGVVDLGKSD